MRCCSSLLSTFFSTFDNSGHRRNVLLYIFYFYFIFIFISILFYFILLCHLSLRRERRRTVRTITSSSFSTTTTVQTMASRRLDISSLLCVDNPPFNSQQVPIPEPIILAPHLRNTHPRNSHHIVPPNDPAHRLPLPPRPPSVPPPRDIGTRPIDTSYHSIRVHNRDQRLQTLEPTPIMQSHPTLNPLQTQPPYRTSPHSSSPSRSRSHSQSPSYSHQTSLHPSFSPSSPPSTTDRLTSPTLSSHNREPPSPFPQYLAYQPIIPTLHPRTTSHHSPPSFPSTHRPSTSSSHSTLSPEPERRLGLDALVHAASEERRRLSGGSGPPASPPSPLVSSAHPQFPPYHFSEVGHRPWPGRVDDVKESMYADDVGLPSFRYREPSKVLRDEHPSDDSAHLSSQSQRSPNREDPTYRLHFTQVTRRSNHPSQSRDVTAQVPPYHLTTSRSPSPHRISVEHQKLINPFPPTVQDQSFMAPKSPIQDPPVRRHRRANSPAPHDTRVKKKRRSSNPHTGPRSMPPLNDGIGDVKPPSARGSPEAEQPVSERTVGVEVIPTEQLEVNNGM